MTVNSTQPGDTMSDQEIGLITDYLFNDLSRDDARQVETRLLSDSAFLDKAMPLIWIFGMKGELHQELVSFARTQPQLARPWYERRWRGWQIFPSRRSIAQMVAALVVCLGGSGVVVHAREASTVPDVTALLPGTAAPALDSATYETALGETKTFLLPDSSRVELRSHSRFTYDSGKWVDDVRLVGEAAFAVSPHSATLRVRTAEGDVFLRAGFYAVRTRPARAAVFVTVGSGHAALWGFTPLAWRFPSSGEFGWLHNGEPDVFFHGNDQFPTLFHKSDK